MLHDRLLLRTTGRPWPVSRSSAAGLRRARLRRGGERVPTFAEAVAALPDGLGVAVDTKDPSAADAVVAELRRRYDVSAAEAGHHDLHRRALVGVAVVAPDRAHCVEVLDSCERWVAGRPEMELLSARQWFSSSNDET